MYLDKYHSYLLHPLDSLTFLHSIIYMSPVSRFPATCHPKMTYSLTLQKPCRLPGRDGWQSVLVYLVPSGQNNRLTSLHRPFRLPVPHILLDLHRCPQHP